MTFAIKIHKSYRTVVALCDSELVGKKFEEGIKQLDVRENFYKGNEIELEELERILQMQIREDATFNIVGQKSVEISIKQGIISEEDVLKVAGIPFALKLL